MARHGRHKQQHFRKLRAQSVKQQQDHPLRRKRHVANGWVFIDELKLTERETLPAESTSVKKATDNSLDCESNDALRGIIVDLTTHDNLLENVLDTTSTESTMPGVVESLGGGAPNGWKSNFDTDKRPTPSLTITSPKAS